MKHLIIKSQKICFYIESYGYLTFLLSHFLFESVSLNFEVVVPSFFNCSKMSFVFNSKLQVLLLNIITISPLTILSNCTTVTQFGLRLSQYFYFSSTPSHSSFTLSSLSELFGGISLQEPTVEKPKSFARITF